jgi:hypothetical protein
MALDATARESNIWDSIKKYFVDSVPSAIPITFDRALSAPKTTDQEVTRWLTFVLGPIDIQVLSDITLDIYCCTRNDNEWFKLAQLADTVRELITDTTTTDGMKRITFYQSHPTNPWTEIGKFIIQEIVESNRMTAQDETKYKIFHVRLRTASKV